MVLLGGLFCIERQTREPVIIRRCQTKPGHHPLWFDLSRLVGEQEPKTGPARRKEDLRIVVVVVVVVIVVVELLRFRSSSLSFYTHTDWLYSAIPPSNTLTNRSGEDRSKDDDREKVQVTFLQQSIWHKMEKQDRFEHIHVVEINLTCTILTINKKLLQNTHTHTHKQYQFQSE